MKGEPAAFAGGLEIAYLMVSPTVETGQRLEFGIEWGASAQAPIVSMTATFQVSSLKSQVSSLKSQVSSLTLAPGAVLAAGVYAFEETGDVVPEDQLSLLDG